MGLLEKQLGLLPVTSNQQMLAQALKSRSKPPMSLKPVTPQGLLDNAAMALSPVPLVGDLVGLGADGYRFATDESSRTPMNYGLAALGLLPFVPPLVSAGLGKFAQSQGKTLGQLPSGPARNQAGAIVYHGSPHKFDQFDSSKIGTGEGAQAYGHGLYFAENPDVAATYARDVTGQKIKDSVGYHKASDRNATSGAVDYFTEMRKGNVPRDTDKFGKPVTDAYIDNQLNLLKQELAAQDKSFGVSPNLYKVDLPDEAIAKMLDWDKPLSQQSQAAKEALTKWVDSLDVNDPKKLRLVDKFDNPRNQNIKFGQLYNEATSSLWGKDTGEMSRQLQQSGLTGIRYLDGGSRGGGAGTSNFVVFPGNEGLLKIIERQ